MPTPDDLNTILYWDSRGQPCRRFLGLEALYAQSEAMDAVLEDGVWVVRLPERDECTN